MSTTTRRIWTGLAAFAAVEVVGLVLLATVHHEPGKLYALGCLSGGFALAFGLLAYYPPSQALNAQICRYAFAASAGFAAYTIASWALWAAGVPIDIGMDRWPSRPGSAKQSSPGLSFLGLSTENQPSPAEL